ncbi:MAG: 5'-methylthioadenosine/adenosylhomocysteine nucleosidase [Anaeroplasmataceae bacterium]|nr:5'-methylthioadenosine/adenosylhomocysteine nucleosidase [Anaeroplasmataceae bacterium]
MIGIIAAMEEEMEILKDALGCDDFEPICGIKFYVGEIENTEVVLCTSGVGKVNAAMAATLLIDHYSCDLVINTGIAGGITGVTSEDIIIANSLGYYDVDTTPFGYSYGQIPGMPKAFTPSVSSTVMIKSILKRLNLSYKEAMVYSGDSFVTSLDQVAQVNTDMPCIAEMEGAAIAQVCTRSGVEFVVLRYISDIVGQADQLKDYQSFESAMAKRSSKICLEIIKNLE